MEGHAGTLGESKATARAVVYRFLSRCFSHPERELLELFDSARLEEPLQSWRYLGLEASEGIARAVDWLAGWPGREAALLELEKEYTRLFVTAYPKVVAPPYSSVYLDEQRRVWGASTAEAARLYEAAGLGMSRDFHDLPDHIAVELEFASYLISEQQKRAGGNDSTVRDLASIEKRFLAEHLFRWAPAFFSRVAGLSRAAFYQAAAELAQQFVEWDAEHLGALQHQPCRQADPR
jgi:DMSO reductase family type II enzyme chaperone